MTNTSPGDRAVALLGEYDRFALAHKQWMQHCEDDGIDYQLDDHEMTTKLGYDEEARDLLDALAEAIRPLLASEATLHRLGVEVGVWKSAGSDGAIVVQIDTEFEPDGSDGLGGPLRVNVNDGIAWGVPWAPLPSDE